jgi:hypothetical protein
VEWFRCEGNRYELLRPFRVQNYLGDGPGALPRAVILRAFSPEDVREADLPRLPAEFDRRQDYGSIGDVGEVTGQEDGPKGFWDFCALAHEFGSLTFCGKGSREGREGREGKLKGRR